MSKWTDLRDVRRLAEELDGVRFSARNPSCVLVSLEIGSGLLKPNEERRGPGTMLHLKTSTEAYTPSVLRYTRLQPGESTLSRMWLSIGRTSDNDVSINDYAVSRRHARFRLVHGVGYVIEDLNSVNGTAVDGTWIEARKQVPVRSGQVLRFGRLGFTFLEPDDFHAFLVTMVPLH